MLINWAVVLGEIRRMEKRLLPLVTNCAMCIPMDDVSERVIQI